ncbi:hypothetical protein Fcan01_27612, partial [Folsomia candida]
SLVSYSLARTKSSATYLSRNYYAEQKRKSCPADFSRGILVKLHLNSSTPCQQGADNEVLVSQSMSKASGTNRAPRQQNWPFIIYGGCSPLSTSMATPPLFPYWQNRAVPPGENYRYLITD